MAESTDLRKLQVAICDMDCLSQSGLSQISAIAKLALFALETPEGYNDTENIVIALQAISHKADEIENRINSQAEEVGCNYKDEQARRHHALATQGISANVPVLELSERTSSSAIS